MKNDNIIRQYINKTLYNLKTIVLCKYYVEASSEISKYHISKYTYNDLIITAIIVQLYIDYYIIYNFLKKEKKKI